MFHRRWAVPVLAELHRAGGCKFVTLANRLSVNQGALRQTLADLIRKGLVMRNPGYGHPMRPEYILTTVGMMLGPSSLDLMECLARLNAEETGLRKWSMPLVLALGRGRLRFSELQGRLHRLTDRALTLALKELIAVAWVERQVVESYPPAIRYCLTSHGQRLFSILSRMKKAVLLEPKAYSAETNSGMEAAARRRGVSSAAS